VPLAQWPSPVVRTRLVERFAVRVLEQAHAARATLVGTNGPDRRTRHYVPVPGRRAAAAMAADAQLRTVRPLSAAVVGDSQSATHAGRRVAGGPPTAPPAYDPLEREPEVLAEQRVNHGIDGAVAVAQPEHDGEQGGLYARRAESPDQVHGEER